MDERSGREETRVVPSAGTSAPPRSSSAERRARLEAWKAQKLGGAVSSSAPAAPAAAVWMPWEETAPQAQPASNAPSSSEAAAKSIPVSSTPAGSNGSLAIPHGGLQPPPSTGGPPPAVASLAKSGLGLTFAAAAKKAAAAAATLDPEVPLDDDVDPLDAFMAAKVAPEVAAKQAEEALKREEERKKLAEMIASGKSESTVIRVICSNLHVDGFNPPHSFLNVITVPTLEELMMDSEEEPAPDLVRERQQHNVVTCDAFDHLSPLMCTSKCCFIFNAPLLFLVFLWP